MKRIRRQARNVGLNREEATPEPFPLSGVGRSRSNVEDVSVRSAKGAVRQIAHGHLNHSIHAPIGSDPQDATTPIPAVPKIALRVDRGTIGPSPAKTLKEGPLVVNGTVSQIIVIRPYLVLHGIAKIEPRVVRTPKNRIRYAQFAPLY
jgi:hypothetical protein